MKTTEQLNELLSVAERAQRGAPWHGAKNDMTMIVGADRSRIADCSVAIGMERAEMEANAAHVAAFDPTTCAELVREVMRLRTERTELGNSITEAAIKCGIIDGSLPLDDPQLLLVCSNLANQREQCAAIIQRELDASEGRGIDFEDLARIKNSILGEEETK